jgi:hypothetical protein
MFICYTNSTLLLLSLLGTNVFLARPGKYKRAFLVSLTTSLSLALIILLAGFTRLSFLPLTTLIALGSLAQS